jgi:hypothetical protein
MNRGCQSVQSKRRTRLTLPSESLQKAESLARSRSANLSTIVAEALDELLRTHSVAERGEEVFKAYQHAFTGFSERELMVLDGFIPETAGK